MNLKNCENAKSHFIHRCHNIGKFYHLPDKFPFILHDVDGCVLIDENNFKNFVRNRLICISQSYNGDKINISKSISRLPGYVKCESALVCPHAKFKKR